MDSTGCCTCSFMRVSRGEMSVMAQKVPKACDQAIVILGSKPWC